MRPPGSASWCAACAGSTRAACTSPTSRPWPAALERLEPPDGEATCLVDGFSLPGCRVPHRAVIEGDGTSAAIAAASVLAKVTRDRYMHGAAGEHPGWGFEEHVGYSTPEHREAIGRIGISPLHRRSFRSVAYSQLGLV